MVEVSSRKLDMSLYDPCLWVCRQLFSFDPAVLRTPPFFRLILTFSYCLYDFLREKELGPADHLLQTGQSLFTDRFNAQNLTAPGFSEVPDTGVMPAFFVVQFISLFFRAHAAAETARVFVVLIFD